MWTKKIPKSPGLYWFWHTNDILEKPEIVEVERSDDGDGNFLISSHNGETRCRVDDTAIYFINYHFGPKILVPSVRDLRKRTKRRER